MVFFRVLVGFSPGLRLPYRECCRYREGLQLLLEVTFITTINMHATQRHPRLGRMLPL